MSQHIKEAYDKLVAERDQLLNSVKDEEIFVNEKLAILRKAQEEYDAARNALNSKVRPKLFTLNNEIASLARLLPNHVKAPQIQE